MIGQVNECDVRRFQAHLGILDKEHVILVAYISPTETSNKLHYARFFIYN